MPETQNTFLDVPFLLESSQPRARGGWFWYAVGAFFLVVLASSLASAQSGLMAQLVSVLSGAAMLLLIVAMGLLTWWTVRRARAEHEQLEAVEELMHLRRWPQAAAVLEQMLSHPTRTPGGRVQALIFLATVLARYSRFEDAILVHNHLLENVRMDPATTHALRLSRAMAMLREDHLLDADRAIGELRRDVRTAGAAEGESPLGNMDSAGLALVELYRDVKTGHPAEAIELFRSALPVMRQKLGHRVGDAWALVARAYDSLAQRDEADAAYANATALTDRSELERRYPEVAALREKYRATEVPTAA